MGVNYLKDVIPPGRPLWGRENPHNYPTGTDSVLENVEVWDTASEQSIGKPTTVTPPQAILVCFYTSNCLR